MPEGHFGLGFCLFFLFDFTSNAAWIGSPDCAQEYTTSPIASDDRQP
jgi:hypothetical protein